MTKRRKAFMVRCAGIAAATAGLLGCGDDGGDSGSDGSGSGTSASTTSPTSGSDATGSGSAEGSSGSGTVDSGSGTSNDCSPDVCHGEVCVPLPAGASECGPCEDECQASEQAAALHCDCCTPCGENCLMEFDQVCGPEQRGGMCCYVLSVGTCAC